MFKQVSGVAMGTSFAVAYAIIYMLYLESPVIEEFDAHIVVYRRFIDDIILLWQGCRTKLSHFMMRLNSRHPAIKLDWSATPHDAAAQRKVNFMDVTITLTPAPPTSLPPRWLGIHHCLFRKPGNLHQYLPFSSSHPRHVFQGWVKAELMRIRRLSSSRTSYLNDRLRFWGLLRARGYPESALRAFFRQVSWHRGASHPEKTPKRDLLGCVWTSVNRPGVEALKHGLDLSFAPLPPDQHAAHPPSGLFAVRSAPRLGTIIGR